jgi:hypothetical protein
MMIGQSPREVKGDQVAKQPTIPIDNYWVGVEMFMKSPDRVWTEKHYYSIPGSGPSITNTDTLALAQAVLPGGLTQLRYNCLAAGCTMPEVRVSQENIYKDSRVSTVPSTYQPSTLAPPAAEFVGNNSLDVRLVASSINFAKTYLGGIPVGTVLGGNYVSGGNTAWDTAFQSYIQALTNDKPVSGSTGYWGLLGLIKDAGTCPRVPIYSITYGGPTTRLLTVVTSSPHKVPNPPVVNVTIPTQCIVRVAYVTGSNANMPVNQLFPVLTSDANMTLTLDASAFFPLTPAFTLYGGGYLQNMVKTFYPYAGRWAGPTAGTRRRGGRTLAKKGRKKKPVNSWPYTGSFPS